MTDLAASSPSAGTVFDQAVARHHAGQLAEAADLYQQTLAADPTHYDARRLLGLVAFQRGQARDAERLLREAIRLAPDNAKGYDNLAVVLHSLKRDDEALPALRKAVDLAPTNPLFLVNLGNLLGEMARPADAVDAFRRAVAATPDNADIHQRLASELLKAGDAALALRHLDTALRLGGPNTTYLALKAVALGTTGAADAFHELMDYDRLVVCRHIGEVHGAPSLQDFNQALAAVVMDSSSLHHDHTTINGLDTTEILDLPHPSTAALRRFIYSEIEARLQSLPAAPHPFAAMAPSTWGTKSWGVKMWRQGYQVTHIHHKAWLSGVYYVQMPEIVRPGQKGNDGWIEFGRGPDDLSPVAPPELRLIQPVLGMLITFPSYVWHRTIPFESKRERISIAFDVVPAD
jgi:thioredoxin-like negative regulator of GroEL